MLGFNWGGGCSDRLSQEVRDRRREKEREGVREEEGVRYTKAKGRLSVEQVAKQL